jgi:hypothetical protein
MKMKQVFLFLLCLLCAASLAFAQAEPGITDDGDEIIAEEDQLEMVSTEREEIDPYNMWSDPLYYQFEKMMPALAKSIGRLDSRISTLAVTNLDFSPNLTEEFRKVASAKLYGQLLIENPKLKLIKCNECNMIRSNIENGILTVSRGLATKDDRQKLARQVGVQGFLTAMIIEDERQLTIVVNVHDAEEGRIILSDVITGIPVAETTYWNFYAGQMQIPIKMDTPDKTVEHSAILAGAEYSKRFSESWIIATNFGFYMDNNQKLVDKETLTAGMMFDGSIGWEALSFMNNDASFMLMTGIGQFLSTQFNFSIYGKVGLKIIVNKLLTFNMYYLGFNPTNIEAPNAAGEASKLTGSASYITFGLQF